MTGPAPSFLDMNAAWVDVAFYFLYIEPIMKTTKDLRRLAVHLVGPELAEDVCQDAWVDALERGAAAPSLNGDLGRLARGKARQMRSPVSANLRTGERLEKAVTADLPADLSMPSEMDAHDLAAIRQVFATLSPLHRHVLHMTVIEGGTDGELAAHFEITVSEAVKLRQTALGALRAAWA